MSWDIQAENKKLKRIAREYRNKGYKVIIEPKGDALPTFLRDIRPDMVATRGKKGVVVEVKSKSTLSNFEHSERLAKIFEERPEWTFHLVITKPTRLPEELDGPPQKEILLERIRETRQIVKKQYLESSVLLLWANVEMALEWLAWKEESQIKSKNSARRLKLLYSLGAISKRNYQLFRKLSDIRNDVAHRGTSEEIKSLHINKTLDALERIVSN